MTTYIWLFALLFIFHDLEEIIGFMPWIKANQELLQKKAPMLAKTHQGLSTEGFAFAVLEEFLLVLLISLLAVISQSRELYLLWLGGFIAYALHLVFHIGQASYLRKYIPSLITSIICLPISCWIIWKAALTVQATWVELLLFSLLGCLIVTINIFFALKLGRQFSNWLRKKQAF